MLRYLSCRKTLKTETSLGWSTRASRTPIWRNFPKHSRWTKGSLASGKSFLFSSPVSMVDGRLILPLARPDCLTHSAPSEYLHRSFSRGDHLPSCVESLVTLRTLFAYNFVQSLALMSLASSSQLEVTKGLVLSSFPSGHSDTPTIEIIGATVLIVALLQQMWRPADDRRRRSILLHLFHMYRTHVCLSMCSAFSVLSQASEANMHECPV